MTNHVNLHGLGTVYVAPIDVYFDIFDAFQPDIIFISTARADIIGKKYIDGAPDMVVEVLSPSSARKDLTHKMVVYERSGVREYWVVDPKAFTVDVYVYREGGFKLDTSVGRDGAIRSTAVEGFEISAETIFGDVWVAPLGRKSIGDCRCYL